jgi:signal transduction histidine kinase
MREIASALRRFYRDTKRVPHSLWELAPDYLENVPKTSDGRAFVYDPRSASIFHPAQFDRRAQQPGPRSQGPRGGQPGLGGATDAYNRAQEEALGQTGF